MIHQRVIDALFGGVGFRNPTKEGYAIVSEENCASSTGMYFDDASYLVNAMNIFDCQTDSDITESDFNILLSNMQKQVIRESCDAIVSGKERLIESINLFPFEKRFSSTLDVGSKFVGFEINPFINENISARIDFIELFFDKDVVFNVHLFNSNSKTPIKTKEVNALGGESTVVKLTDWVISNSETYKGGKFYLGYFESDLGDAKPYAKDWELANEIFGMENINGNLLYANNYLTIQLTSLTAVDDFFDVSSRVYMPDSFGMNIGVNIYSDYSEQLIRCKDLVFPLVQLKMAEKVVNLIKTSIRSNSTERTIGINIDDANFELYGNKALGINGIIGKYEAMLKTVRGVFFYQNPISIGTLR